MARFGNGKGRGNGRTRTIHWGGPLRYTKTDGTTTEVLGGWAACCSGRRAEAIRAAGANTEDPRRVTCGTCRELLSRGGVTRPKREVGERVVAYDAAAEAMGAAAWQPAEVIEVLEEDGAWWVRVRFDGGRCSMLRAYGVR